MAQVAHVAFILLLCGWGVFVLIGIGSSAWRWLRDRREQPGKGVAKAFGGSVH